MNQLLSHLDSVIVERFGWTLVHSVWQIVIVAAAVAAATLVPGRQRANVRYFVFCVGMLACIVIPIGIGLAASGVGKNKGEHGSPLPGR